MDGIRMSRRPRDRELKVTVSVRAGEWLDRDGPPLIYRDPLLANDSSFPINGLTRNELAAEKLLGWCSKPLSKHLVDLAHLAREHHEHISHEQVAKLVHRKFEMEKGARRYRDAAIRSPADLVAGLHEREQAQGPAQRLGTLLDDRAALPARRANRGRRHHAHEGRERRATSHRVLATDARPPPLKGRPSRPKPKPRRWLKTDPLPSQRTPLHDSLRKAKNASSGAVQSGFSVTQGDPQ